MATRNTPSKPDDPAPEQASAGDKVTAGGDERMVVPPAQGQEHGYIGSVPPDKDRDAFTVAGVTGGTANVADTPKSVTREGTKPVS